MPHAVRQNKDPSTSMLTEEGASHDESSCVTRVTRDPSASALTETKGEASQDESSTHEESEPEQEVYINPTHLHAPQPVYTSMYMPYIEGLKMDWKVHYIIDSSNGNSSARIFWNVNSLLSPNAKKCKKVITWSGNFGMEQYVCWGLSKDDMNLDTIWERLDNFCKWQSNEVHAQFDLLTSFCQGNKSVNEWYNAVQAQVTLQNIHLKLQRFYIATYFGSSYEMKILCQGPLWKEVLTLTSFLPVGSIS